MTQLHIDLRTRHTLHSIWSFGINLGPAAMLLRADVQRHLRMCRDEAGFRHVRCSGWLADEMHILQGDGSYDFTKIEQSIDVLMENGMTPWMELSSMPAAIAQEGTSAGTMGPPRDWQKWGDLVGSLVQSLSDRYGCDVREWHFDVGNAPDQRWTGTQAEYFKLYDMAARAVKNVDHGFKVGGPATDGAAWVGELLDHVSRESSDFGLDAPRIEFVSTQVFPDDVTSRATQMATDARTMGGDAAAIGEGARDLSDSAHLTATAELFPSPGTPGEGEGGGLPSSAKPPPQPSPGIPGEGVRANRAGVETNPAKLPSRPRALQELLRPVRAQITAAVGDYVPLLCTAWNSRSRGLSPQHDHCNNAAFICRTMAELSEPDPDTGNAMCQGSMFWNVSDISLDATRYEPFHGGCGLVTVNDIRKASFYAFKLLNEHRGERIATRWDEPVPGLGAMVSYDGYELRILAWLYKDPDGTTPRLAKFTVHGLPESVRWGQLTVLRPAAGSPYEGWVELGKPQFVNRDLLDTLEHAAHPVMTEVDFVEFPPRLEPGMVIQLTIPVPHDTLDGMD